MTPDTTITLVARAILKARFYDSEPEAYGTVDEFFADIEADYPEHVAEARREAVAAIEAMQKQGDLQ